MSHFLNFLNVSWIFISAILKSLWLQYITTSSASLVTPQSNNFLYHQYRDWTIIREGGRPWLNPFQEVLTITVSLLEVFEFAWKYRQVPSASTKHLPFVSSLRLPNSVAWFLWFDESTLNLILYLSIYLSWFDAFWDSNGHVSSPFFPILSVKFHIN